MTLSTVGRWLIVNHKHDDYASAALTLVNVTNTIRLYGGENEKEMLVFVHIFLVCGGGFFQYCVNVKIHVQVRFTVASQFYFHIKVDLFIRDLTHFYGGEKQVC